MKVSDSQFKGRGKKSHRPSPSEEFQSEVKVLGPIVLAMVAGVGRVNDRAIF